MTHKQLPTAAQVGAYLSAHGWRFARPMKHPGSVFTYRQLSDSGRPIELFVPDDEGLEFNERGRSVMAVVETVVSFEGREAQSVLADMLAIEPVPAPEPPGVPVP